MKQKQWEKISSVLEEVIAIEPSARRDFLNNSDIDAEILEEVESLLAFEEEAEDFMSLPAKDFSVGFMSEEEIGAKSADRSEDRCL